MVKKKYHAKRLSPGHYLYRGYRINSLYYSPEGKVVWEAVDHDGSGFGHSFSLRECKGLVDDDCDRIEAQKK